ncbi:N-acetylmuramidase domain-containing protein [Pseudooceanicola sp. C21-150M6]|uniref:N-acetylmuramidase domain-containing protein n=1 Tax=Pseudooceanicola sp. C21-150M6 TaxID=3434355 RepID=UPI003D7F5DB0
MEKDMTYPWRGAARPMPAGAFDRAARELGCEKATIQAIWMTESAGRGFRSDGTLERRFEPHKMPGSAMTWRESLKINAADREEMLRDSFAEHPEATLRATSWGGPQIMGFNAADAGYSSALDMVRDMAASEETHLEAFVSLVTSWGLDSAIRAHDWQRIETRYNGGGQGGAYARKMEAHYRNLTGRASPVVLRLGSAGGDVRRLQGLVGVQVDGEFGRETDSAVREFQAAAGLPVDGVVGRRTWEALGAAGVKPKAQETPKEAATDKLGKVIGAAGGVGGVVAAAGQIKELLPPLAYDGLAYGAVAMLLVAAVILLFRTLMPRKGDA